jgi:hypothetical protein
MSDGARVWPLHREKSSIRVPAESGGTDRSSPQSRRAYLNRRTTSALLRCSHARCYEFLPIAVVGPVESGHVGR